jgi:ZIP family zinc transporter
MISDLIIPFVGTALGSAAVFFMKKEINSTLTKLLCGFAAGVMTAASVWSLLIPSIEMSGGGRLSFLPALTGFLSGVAFLLILDLILRKIGNSAESKIEKATRLTALAVTLHNIPEGMAVGVTVAAALNSHSPAAQSAAAALSMGIAIQNFPEGAIISMPMRSQGISKTKAFIYGTLSGAVEPVFGALTVLLTGIVTAALPFLLAFAAGAMIFVVAEELIPEAKSEDLPSLAAIGVSLGFSVMMTLDVLFS